MSTLLAVGLANDPPAMHVNAVAGIAVPGGIMSLIATETTLLQHVSNSLGNNQTSPPRTSEITRIVVGDDDRAKSLLRNVQTDDKDIMFEEHLEDIATIVAFFLRQGNTPRDTVFIGLFYLFTIRRSFRKLSARLDSMYHIWGDLGPIAIMEEWFKEHALNLNESVVKFDGVGSCSIQNLRDRLTSHGVPSSGVRA